MPQTLYTRLGGQPAIDATVDLFYKKLLGDDRVNYFFAGLDMKAQVKKQKLFMKAVLEGPFSSNSNLRSAHQPLIAKGLNENHFEIVGSHLRATMEELSVNSPLIEEVMSIVEKTRKDVLNQ